MTEPKLYLFVCHPGVNTPELAAMTDLNPTGVKPAAVDRQAETDLLCSKAFKAAIERRSIQLTNCAEFRDAGLPHMTCVWTADPYKPLRDLLGALGALAVQLILFQPVPARNEPTEAISRQLPGKRSPLYRLTAKS